MLILTSPEIFTLYGFFPAQLSWVDYFKILALSFSFLVLGYSTLIMKSIDLDNFSRKAFLGTLLTVGLVLFKIPLVLLIASAVVISLNRYKRFYNFEVIADLK